MSFNTCIPNLFGTSVIGGSVGGQLDHIRPNRSKGQNSSILFKKIIFVYEFGPFKIIMDEICRLSGNGCLNSQTWDGPSQD